MRDSGSRAGRLLAAALAAASIAVGAHAARAATYQVIYDFRGLDGTEPAPLELALDGSGILYGSTEGGGARGNGTVWKLPLPGTSGAAGPLTVLHAFGPGDTVNDGNPSYGVLRDRTGRLFVGASDAGNLWSITPGTNALSLVGALSDLPSAVVFGPQGQILVAGFWFGALVQYEQFLGGWQQDTLYTFGVNDDAAQITNLTTSPDGTLYGTTLANGPDGISPDGSIAGYVFQRTAGQSGVTFLTSVPAAYGHPAGVMPDGQGNLYIVAGNVFGTSPHDFRSGIFRWRLGQPLAVVHTFSSATGDRAEQPPVFGADGALYGTTLRGGPTNNGVVYRLTTGGQYSVVHGFTGGADGGFPDNIRLLPGPGGWLYGTTPFGGAYGQGLVFRVHP